MVDFWGRGRTHCITRKPGAVGSSVFVRGLKSNDDALAGYTYDSLLLSYLETVVRGTTRTYWRRRESLETAARASGLGAWMARVRNSNQVVSGSDYDHCTGCSGVGQWVVDLPGQQTRLLTPSGCWPLKCPLPNHATNQIHTNQLVLLTITIFLSPGYRAKQPDARY